MSDLDNPNQVNTDNIAKQAEELLQLHAQAQLSYYAAEVLSTEFQTKIELLIPHLQSTWADLDLIKNSLPVASEDQNKKLIAQRESLVDNLAKSSGEFSQISDDILKINFKAGDRPSNLLIRRLESHTSRLGDLLYRIRLYLLKLSGWRPWYKRRSMQILLILLVILMSGLYAYSRYQRYQLGFKVIKSSQQWGSLALDRSVEGSRLKVSGTACSSGLGTHARSEIILELQPDKSRLQGICGLDDEGNARGGSIQCEIKQENETLFKSHILKDQDRSIPFDIEVKSSLPVKLIVSDGGNGIGNDHADWCNLIAK